MELYMQHMHCCAQCALMCALRLLDNLWSCWRTLGNASHVGMSTSTVQYPAALSTASAALSRD
jgi:hypothetical protein